MKRMGSRSKSQTGMDKEGQTEITITNVPVYDPWGHLTEVKCGQFGQMIIKWFIANKTQCLQYQS